MPKPKIWYTCTLTKFPRFPYIARVFAKSKTAAANLFLKYLKDGNFRLQRVSVSAVDVTEIPLKRIKPEAWSTVLGYEGVDESEK